ncbi:MAG: enoyl-CoA hydratase/isomerase family protein [Deltaproteobacteria bacterium]|nr:enoyl-CoA hydratase/isomerase family protein [Deltaproteobacteria bacterium]
MTCPGLRVAQNGDAVVITFDRPEAKNALSRALVRTLQESIDRASAEPSVRAVILTAVDDVFVAGGDLREFAELMQSPTGVQEVIAMGTSLLSIERCDVPVIAAVQGAAYGGGCELILACDLALMETDATLSFRQAAVGLSSAWGGAIRLIERVGPMRASQLMLLGEAISARQAAEWNLVNLEVPSGACLDRALEWTRMIARQPRAAVAGCKRALRETREARRADAFAKEAQVFSSLWNGPDHRAAMASFLNRSR